MKRMKLVFLYTFMGFPFFSFSKKVLLFERRFEIDSLVVHATNLLYFVYDSWIANCFRTDKNPINFFFLMKIDKFIWKNFMIISLFENYKISLGSKRQWNSEIYISYIFQSVCRFLRAFYLYYIIFCIDLVKFGRKLW